jgi:hypothetical protein
MYVVMVVIIENYVANVTIVTRRILMTSNGKYRKVQECDNKNHQIYIYIYNGIKRNFK